MGFPASLFSGRNYLVYGLGNSGTCTVKTLLATGATVFAWDDSPHFSPQDWQKSLSNSDLSHLHLQPLTQLPAKADALILSPGIPHLGPKTHPVARLAQQQQIPILSDVELFYQAVRKAGSEARFIAITGTNGKSTCTALTAHLLKQENHEVIAGGNIGKAAMSLPLFGDKGIYVIEMSSYMLERMSSFQPEIAAWTTFSPDHLDRHENLEGYRQAKRNIFNHLAPSGLAVFGEKKAWSLEEAALLERRNIRCEWAQDVPEKELPDAPSLPGPHNRDNLALSILIAKFLGLSNAAIRSGAKTFEGLPHRLKQIGNIKNIAFVNDSKATNFEAALPALNAWHNIFWIAGGIAKANGIEGIEKARAHIKYAFLIGRDAPKLAQTLKKTSIPYRIFDNLRDATEAAYEKARQEDKEAVILLSPACASQDQFQNFEERGNLFTELVEHIIKKTYLPAAGKA